jgi:hypothetical protein
MFRMFWYSEIPVEDSVFAPYAPGLPTVRVVRRIHEGTSGSPLTIGKLTALGAAEGNAIRVQRALGFLGLIDEEGALTESARRLRKAHDDEYPLVLAEILRSAYAPVFEIQPDPAAARDIELANAFRQFDPAGQRDNMIRLFVALCQEAKLMPPAPAEGVSRKARIIADRKAGASTPRIRGESPRRHKPAGDSLMGQLMAKFPEFNPEWAPEVQAKWFEAFDSLRSRLDANK